MPFIQIVPISLHTFPVSDKLKEIVCQTFKTEAVISDIKIDVSDAYDSHRNQYRSSLILTKLNQRTEENTLKVLGITDLDLFMPILTFVFGEAQLSGTSSVISTFRLKNQFYGLPENNELLNERICKEAIHELGHNFGLLHCDDYRCVMKSSTYVEDIDIKSIEPCSSCKGLLGRINPG